MRPCDAGGGLEVIEEVELHEIDQTDRDLIDHTVAVGIETVAAGHGRRLDAVHGAVEYEARRGDDALAIDGGGLQIRVVGLQTHLRVEGTDEKFANRDGPTLGEKG